MHCAIIGREINLAYVELESVAGNFDIINHQSVVFDFDTTEQIDINRFGTIIKLAEVVKTIPKSKDISYEVSDTLKKIVLSRKISNIDFGLSVYGHKLPYKIYKKLLLSSKKQLKKDGIKARFVESNDCVLNAAQIKHNKLDSSGIEILLLYSKNQIILATTYAVQDIDSYSKRDFGRPCRDMKVGMFPPKLAQSMINISSVQDDSIIYDPFCGSGIVLQESLLRGVEVWGSDISDKMVMCSNSNLEWLNDNFSINQRYRIFEADATKPIDLPTKKYHIVTEGFLGKPFGIIPSEDDLKKVKQELSVIYLEFLRNTKNSPNLPENIVLTLPCWKQKDGLEYLNIIDQIQKLGYTIKQFQSVDYNKIVYKRPNQIVGRQILVLIPIK